MRADRLLSIMLLLKQHGHMTAQALAEQLEVTERTIYRDMTALSTAGIPVFTRSGPEGGCFLDPHFRSRLNWFTPEELQTLLYAGSASPLSALGIQRSMDNAILKLLSMLPKQIPNTLMQQRLYLDPSGWYGTLEEHQALPLLKEAVWNDWQITARYETWQGQPQEISLAPYSLVYKADRWYVVALNLHRQQLRIYRAARLTDIQLQATHFERNPEFDIQAYWNEAHQRFLGQLPSYPVTLRVHPDSLIYFRHTLAGRYEVLEKNAHWWTLQVHYMVFEEARSSVLGLGDAVEVVEPAALGQAVLDQARAILKRAGIL